MFDVDYREKKGVFNGRYMMSGGEKRSIFKKTVDLTRLLLDIEKKEGLVNCRSEFRLVKSDKFVTKETLEICYSQENSGIFYEKLEKSQNIKMISPMLNILYMFMFELPEDRTMVYEELKKLFIEKGFKTSFVKSFYWSFASKSFLEKGEVYQNDIEVKGSIVPSKKEYHNILSLNYRNIF
jgi:hypothetical protein